MRKIREIVYKLGFRPKWGSIFFSPSLALHYKFVDRVKKIKKDRRKNNWGGKF